MSKETILVVEDESSLREVIRVCLEHSGYTILEADNGVDALYIESQFNGPIHLLLSDVDMSPITGPDLAEQVLVVRPDIQILLTSGRTEDMELLTGLGQLNAHFLQKPFNPKTLNTAVEKILHSDIV